MRALLAIVEELVSQRVLAEIPYVRVSRISDHGPPEVLTTEFAFFTHPTQGWVLDEGELPFLQRITFPVDTMSHLPSPVGGSADALTNRITLALANVDYQDTTLFELLEVGARLDRANLTAFVICVPGSEMGSDPQHRSFLNGDFTIGDEVRFFEGIVDRVTAVGTQIELQCKSLLPVTPWKLVPDDGSDPRDRGIRLPIALGTQAVVRCVNLIVGEVSGVQQPVAIGDGQVLLSAGHDFPGFGSAMLGAEAIEWTSVNGDLLEGVTRGELGTVEANHVAGTVVIELSTLTIGVSSEPISGITGLFVINETTGLAIELSDLLYSVNFDDETTLPGVSGDGIVTITLTAAQLAVVVSGILADATVVQQAIYVTASSPPLQSKVTATKTAGNLLFDQASGATGDWTAEATAPVWTFNKTSIKQEGLRGTFGDGLGVNVLFGLRNVRFDFALDVTTLTAPLTVGLTVTGAEGILVGFIDGSVVATVGIDSTGTVTVEGTTYLAIPGHNVGELEGVVINVIKGEIGGGNPNLVFEVTDVSVRFTFVDDLEELTEEVDALARFDVTRGVASTWDGNWTLASQFQDQVASPDDRRMQLFWDDSSFPTILASTFGEDASIVDAELSFDSTYSNGDAGATEARCVFDPVSVGIIGWDDILISVPATKVNDHSAGSGTVTSTINMTMKQGIALKDIPTLAVDIRNVESVPIGTFPSQRMTIVCKLKLTYVQKKTTVELERDTDAQIEASAGGFGLEFFAVCDGPEAVGGGFIAPNGAVLSHPGDIMRTWLELHGETNVAHFSDSDYDDATPGYQFGFDARNLGSTFEEVLLRLAYEGSANVVHRSDVLGVTWDLLFPNASFAFPTPGATLDSISDLIAIGKDTDEIETRLTVFSNFDPRFDSLDNRSFTQVQTTDPLAAAVIAREDEFGRNDADPQFLLAHNLKLGVTNWRLYQEQELGRPARIFSFRLDHWQAYALERGDIHNLSHPLVDSGALVKVRIIEVERNQTSGWQIRAVEVL